MQLKIERKNYLNTFFPWRYFSSERNLGTKYKEQEKKGRFGKI